MIEAGGDKIASRPGRCSALCNALLALLLVCGAMPVLAADPSDRVGAPDRVLRLAFSAKMFTDVKVEDARAAMKLWIMTVARERSIPMDPEPKIYETLEENERAINAFEHDTTSSALQ